MKYRKCCDTIKGNGPHMPNCVHADSRRRRHRNPLHGLDKATRRMVLDDLGGDLPDGAYFALAGQFGLDTDDFLE